MEYFSLSPFYERNSINEQCAAQRLDFNEKRMQLIGIEFFLEQVSPEKDLYLVSKSYRRSFKDKVLISYYFVFKGTIYQAPNLFSIITTHLESISNNLNNVILEINEKE